MSLTARRRFLELAEKAIELSVVPRDQWRELPRLAGELGQLFEYRPCLEKPPFARLSREAWTAFHELEAYLGEWMDRQGRKQGKIALDQFQIAANLQVDLQRIGLLGNRLKAMIEAVPPNQVDDGLTGRSLFLTIPFELATLSRDRNLESITDRASELAISCGGPLEDRPQTKTLVRDIRTHFQKIADGRVTKQGFKHWWSVLERLATQLKDAIDTIPLNQADDRTLPPHQVEAALDWTITQLPPLDSPGPRGQKTGQTKKKTASFPRNPDVQRLLLETKRAANRNRIQIDIARQLTNDDESKAQNLARQARRWEQR